MWRPTGERVLVELDALAEAVSAGGVVLPGQAVSREKVRRGTVRAVGRDVRADLGVGDRVVLSSFAGTSVDGDEALRIVAAGEVLAVVTDD